MVSDEEWQAYKLKYHKIYKDKEDEQMRRELYSKVRLRVDEHNKLYKAKMFRYSKDVNKYSDHTAEELAMIDWSVNRIVIAALERID